LFRPWCLHEEREMGAGNTGEGKGGEKRKGRKNKTKEPQESQKTAQKHTKNQMGTGGGAQRTNAEKKPGQGEIYKKPFCRKGFFQAPYPWFSVRPKHQRYPKKRGTAKGGRLIRQGKARERGVKGGAHRIGRGGYPKKWPSANHEKKGGNWVFEATLDTGRRRET